MTYVSEVAKSPVRAGLLQPCIVQALADIGATGAPTLDTNSDPGVTITRAGAGDYDLTFPIGGVVRPPKIVAVSDNIDVVQVRAFDAAAGTCSIQCYSDGGSTAADPSSGSELYFEWLAAKVAK